MNNQTRNYKKNKRGQVGETITWFFATVIIIVILAISILAATLLTKGFKTSEQSFFQTTDILASKSMFSYMLTPESSGTTIYSQIKNDNAFDSFNGNLALEVFRGLYQKDYLDNPTNIWLGIVVNTEKIANGQSCSAQTQFCILDSLTNSFFGKRPIGELNTDLGYHTVPFTSEKIVLDPKRYLELSLTGK